MSALAVRAEVVKLERLLGVKDGRLDYMEKLGADALRAVRERATDVLFDADRERFQRIAGASKIPPSALTAALAQRAFGPLICARVAGLLDTSRAIDLAGRLPPEFLADLAVELDPRRASDVIARMPARDTAMIAAELGRRGDHVAMGRFVGHMNDEAIRASIAVLDDAALLQIAYVMESKERLDRVVSMISTERRQAMIRLATEQDLWPEALDLLANVSDKCAGELADLAAGESDAVLSGMVTAAQRDGLWDAVLPVTRAMSEQGRRRFAALPSLHKPKVMAAIVAAAAREGLWPDLLPLVAYLPEKAQRMVWPEVLREAEAMSDTDLRALVKQALTLEIDAVVPGLVEAADESGRWEAGLRLLARLGPALQKRLVPLTESVPAERRARGTEQAQLLGLLDDLGPLAAALSG
jgi:hypothetical protein